MSFLWSHRNYLDRMRAVIRLRRYSIRMEETYVDWARRFILFHHSKRHSKEMGAEEVAEKWRVRSTHQVQEWCV